MTDQDLVERSRALDELDLDDLEDFDSDELADEERDEDFHRSRDAYLADVWQKAGFNVEGESPGQRFATAHRMVQTIVNTFSTDGWYRVTFDPSVSTAGTDMAGRRTVVNPAPLLDPELTTPQAVSILTALAAHEISHPRYGRNTALAVSKVFGRKRAPQALSNLLDDVRIERRFAEDYPGYADIFRPAGEYILRRGLKEVPDLKPSLDNMTHLATLAVRYPGLDRWDDDELKAERAWWIAWADRWAPEDAPRRHVEAVREGLKHILEVKARRRARREAIVKKARAAMKNLTETQILALTLEQLPLPVRRAIRLASQGKSGDEVAAIMGVSTAQAKVLLRSGRKAVAEARSQAQSQRAASAAPRASRSSRGEPEPLPKYDSGEDPTIHVTSESLFEFLRDRGYKVEMKASAFETEEVAQ